MLADNEMPDYAELIISDCRKIRAQIIAEQGDNADALLAFSPYTRTAAVIAGLADALDKAQRERDTETIAFGAWLITYHVGKADPEDIAHITRLLAQYRASHPLPEGK